MQMELMTIQFTDVLQQEGVKIRIKAKYQSIKKLREKKIVFSEILQFFST